MQDASPSKGTDCGQFRDTCSPEPSVCLRTVETWGAQAHFKDRLESNPQTPKREAAQATVTAGVWKRHLYRDTEKMQRNREKNS